MASKARGGAEVGQAALNERRRDRWTLVLAAGSLVVALASAFFTFDATRIGQATVVAVARSSCESALVAELDKFYGVSAGGRDSKGLAYAAYGFAWTSADRIDAACSAEGVIPPKSPLGKTIRRVSSFLADAYTKRATPPYEYVGGVLRYNEIMTAWTDLIRAALTYVQSLPSPSGVPGWWPFAPSSPQPTSVPEDAARI